MPAIRTARSAEGKFVMIANGAAQDRRLTAAARGIILFVLSLPPGTHLTAEWLERQLPDGRRAIRSALRNLEECGYFRRTRTRASGGHWQWEQVISDAPLDPAESEFLQVAPSDRFRSDELTCNDALEPEFPQVAPSDRFPSDGKRSDKELKTGSSKTGKDLKDEGHDHPSAEQNGSNHAPKGAASDERHIGGARRALAGSLGLPETGQAGDWRDTLDPLAG